MKNEKLMRAIGEIDEDLIAEAHEMAKPRVRWGRWSAMAAGFALLIACVPLLMMVLGGGAVLDAAPEMEMVADVNSYYSATVQGTASGEGLKNELDRDENDLLIQEIIDGLHGATIPSGEVAPETEMAEPLERVYRVGETVRAEGLTVQYLAADETTMDLHIKKNDNTPLVISVTVLSSDGETESAWLASSERDAEYFSFTVGGEKVDALPTLGGAYDITVDFSAFLKNGARLSGRVVINETIILIRE